MSLFRTTRAILEGATGSKAVLRPATDEPRPDLFGPPGIEGRRISQRGTRAYMAGYGGENAVDWVADAVDYWAKAASTAEYHFERDGKRLKDEEHPDFEGARVPSSLEGLMRQPNPFQTHEDLFWLLVADLLLTGDGYWLKYQIGPDGRPLALYRLNPSFMELEAGSSRPVDTYLYRVEGVPQPVEYTPEEVIHFKLPNPNSNTNGMGIIQRGGRVYDSDIALVETIAQFFENGAKLSGVLQSDRSVPDPLIKKVQRQFASMYSLASRSAYKVAVLERGLTFQSIQPTAADAEFENLTKLGRDRIFLMFGMNPVLVNADSARPGLLDEAERNFTNKHMRPFLDSLERAVTAELTDAWGVKFKLDYEYVMPEKDRLALAAAYSSLPGIKVREIRERVGLAPLGDERDDIVLNLPGMGVEAGGTPTGALPGPQGGRPANPNNLIGAAAPDGQTRPDARYSRAQAAKAVIEGAPIDEILASLEQRGEESPATEADDSKAMMPAIQITDRVVEVLAKYRQAPKSERAEAVGELAAGEWPSNTKKLRGRVIAHVAEGFRRGYDVDKIVDGYEDEQFDSLRKVIADGASEAA